MPFAVRGSVAHWTACLVAICALGLAAPVDAQEENTGEEQEAPASNSNGLTITSADGDLSMTFGGRFQLRYEMGLDDFEPGHSSFFLRRLQPDIRGEAFGGDLSFRLMPDLSRQASLRDGWVSYRFSDGLQLRAGQFTVPFNWERHAPPTRHNFVERSVANDQFQAATGRDIGLMVHGNPVDRFHYGVGVFSGQGINQRFSDTTGHLFSGRIAYALAGEYPLTEVLVRPAEEMNLAIGAGAYLAIDNTARDWNPLFDFDDPTAEPPGSEANVLSTTADLHLQISRFSMHLAGFFWNVSPTAESYQGFGYTGHLGALILPERLLATARYSESRPDLDEEELSRREVLLGVQIFHRGNDSKFHVEAGQTSEHDGDVWQNGQVIRAQYQFLF